MWHGPGGPLFGAELEEDMIRRGHSICLRSVKLQLWLVLTTQTHKSIGAEGNIDHRDAVSYLSASSYMTKVTEIDFASFTGNIALEDFQWFAFPTSLSESSVI